MRRAASSKHSVCPSDGWNYGRHFCANDGTCVKQDEGIWVCSCLEGSYGEHCEYKQAEKHEKCNNNKICQNGGICRVGLSNYRPPTSLEFLEYRRSTVTPVSAITTGTFRNNNNQQEGNNWRHRTLLSTISNGDQGLLNLQHIFSNRQQQEGDEYCVCPHGYVGPNCEYPMQVCHPRGRDVCFHGGSCIQMTRQQKDENGPIFQCLCAKGSTGEYCQHKQTDNCAKGLACYNGATCDAITDQCICPDGYGGPFCSYPDLPQKMFSSESTENDGVVFTEAPSSSTLAVIIIISLLSVFFFILVLLLLYRRRKKKLCSDKRTLLSTWTSSRRLVVKCVCGNTVNPMDGDEFVGTCGVCQDFLCKDCIICCCDFCGKQACSDCIERHENSIHRRNICYSCSMTQEQQDRGKNGTRTKKQPDQKILTKEQSIIDNCEKQIQGLQKEIASRQSQIHALEFSLQQAQRKQKQAVFFASYFAQPSSLRAPEQDSPVYIDSRRSAFTLPA